MSSVAFTLPILGLFLLQAPERAREPRQPAQTFDLAQTVPEPSSPTVPGEKAFGKLFQQAQERAARQALHVALEPLELLAGRSGHVEDSPHRAARVRRVTTDLPTC